METSFDLWSRMARWTTYCLYSHRLHHLDHHLSERHYHGVLMMNFAKVGWLFDVEYVNASLIDLVQKIFGLSLLGLLAKIDRRPTALYLPYRWTPTALQQGYGRLNLPPSTSQRNLKHRRTSHNMQVASLRPCVSKETVVENKEKRSKFTQWYRLYQRSKVYSQTRREDENAKTTATVPESGECRWKFSVVRRDGTIAVNTGTVMLSRYLSCWLRSVAKWGIYKLLPVKAPCRAVLGRYRSDDIA